MITREQFDKLEMIVGKPITDGPYKDTWMGVSRYMFTFGLVAGIDKHGYATRYCYAKLFDCLIAFAQWDGIGDPPGPWIKQKPEERFGPGSAPPSIGPQKQPSSVAKIMAEQKHVLNELKSTKPLNERT